MNTFTELFVKIVRVLQYKACISIALYEDLKEAKNEKLERRGGKQAVIILTSSKR